MVASEARKDLLSPCRQAVYMEHKARSLTWERAEMALYDLSSMCKVLGSYSNQMDAYDGQEIEDKAFDLLFDKGINDEDFVDCWAEQAGRIEQFCQRFIQHQKGGQSEPGPEGSGSAAEGEERVDRGAYGR